MILQGEKNQRKIGHFSKCYSNNVESMWINCVKEGKKRNFRTFCLWQSQVFLRNEQIKRNDNNFWHKQKWAQNNISEKMDEIDD